MLNESVSEWIERLRAGDDAAAEHLWTRYFGRLANVAARRMPRDARREIDEEDVALSAFHSLCRGAQGGRFPRLHDRDNLWALLLVITARKAQHAIRDRARLKRGGGRVVGESALGTYGSAPDAMASLLGSTPSADFAAQVAEETERRIASLPDDDMRAIARHKLYGSSNDDIAASLGCAVRTVERRLRLIRKLWSEDESSGGGEDNTP